MIREITLSENQVLVCVFGSIYVEEAGNLCESLQGYIEKGHKKIVIDLRGVDYIDRSGLGTLAGINKHALRSGVSIIIQGLQGLVKELFEFSRFTTAFKIQ
jgi:anti-sigma B factor antagonist